MIFIVYNFKYTKWYDWFYEKSVEVYGFVLDDIFDIDLYSLI